MQKAWLEHDVAQCGYCQAGQIMTAAALLKSKPNPSDEAIENAMNGNICPMRYLSANQGCNQDRCELLTKHFNYGTSKDNYK